MSLVSYINRIHWAEGAELLVMEKKSLGILLPVILMAVCSICTVSCGSDDDDNDIPNNPSKKYLAEISIKEYEWKFGERSSYGELYELYKYNEKGKLTSSESHHYSAVIKGRYLDRTDYVYDDRDRVIEKNEYDFSILQYKYKYEYNSFDSVSVMCKYSKSGSLNETHQYEYDNSKRLSKETEIVNYVRNDYGYVRSYEYSGNTVTVTTTMLEDGSFFGKSVYEYDSHHNLVKSSYTSGTDGKTTSSVYKYEYDSKGRLIKKTSPDLSHERYREYTYNEDGTIEKIHVSNNYNNDQSDLVYTYTYK